MPEENENEDTTGAKSEELGEAGKKALENERKARQAAEKRAKELEAKVKEAEDAEKTELEKLQGKVAELEQEAKAATAKADRIEIATAAGLTPAQARRLVGSTREELEADATAMAEELGLKKDEGKKDEENEDELPQDERPLGRPKEELRSGSSTPEDGGDVNASKLAESILKAPY